MNILKMINMSQEELEELVQLIVESPKLANIFLAAANQACENLDSKQIDLLFDRITSFTAKRTHKMYSVLIEQGFTKTQAFELLKVLVNKNIFTAGKK